MAGVGNGAFPFGLGSEGSLPFQLALRAEYKPLS